MTDTTPKSAASESEAFLEASKMPATEQQGTLIGRDSSISVPSAGQATSSAIKINKDSGIYSNVVELSINESSSIPIYSQMVANSSEVENNPTMPLISSRAEDVATSTNEVDDRICDLPPSERAPLIECMRCCFVINYNIRAEEEEQQLGNSKYILLALVALLAIPMSSIYFGVVYKNSCPMAKYSPVFLIAMGVVGVISIVFHLLTVSIRRLLSNMKKPPKTIQISLIFMLTVLMITEMMSFYIKKPVFEDPRDPAFCEKTFYDYMFYMNFVVPIIGILALFLHIRLIPCSSEQMLPQ